MPQPRRSNLDALASDQQLVAAVRGGDVPALAALYARFSRALMATAYRLLLSRDDAEDVLHDVFVGLPEALRRYQERGALESWLKRVTVRVALSRLRQDRASGSVPLEHSTLQVEPLITEQSISLHAAIAALPESLRAALVLKEVEGFSHAEIAELLGISKGASQVRLYRALRQPRAALGDR